MTNTIECTRCSGKGRQYYAEGDRYVADICYGCCGTGRVNEELHLHQRISDLAASLAVSAAGRLRRVCNEKSDGKGWALAATERVMTELEYSTAVLCDLQDVFGKELGKLPDSLQIALLDLLTNRAQGKAAT
jgi:hypothetical protein